MVDEKEILGKLSQKIDEAQEADGFFVTVSYRREDELHHYQARIRFKFDDCISSLAEIEELVRKGEKRTPLSIVRFKSER